SGSWVWKTALPHRSKMVIENDRRAKVCRGRKRSLTPSSFGVNALGTSNSGAQEMNCTFTVSRVVPQALLRLTIYTPLSLIVRRMLSLPPCQRYVVARGE